MLLIMFIAVVFGAKYLKIK